MKKPPKFDKNDLQLFQDAMQGTTPLKQKKNKIRLHVKKEATPRKAHFETQKEQFCFLERDIDNTVTSETNLSFNQSSISNKILRKLRKGQYNVAAVLDLHGKSVEEARIALDTFLQDCLESHIKIALIIHGKGNITKTPILKSQLNNWLQQTSVVLAYCSALPKHGGTGAVYVMLKSNKQDTRCELE